MRGILEIVSPAATLVEALEPIRSDPDRGGVLLDIDGTLAPIVRHAADAHVPEATRALLIEIAKRYGVVGCISGRRAATARQIVAIGTLAYVGNHGGELLRPRSTRPEVDPELERRLRHELVLPAAQQQVRPADPQRVHLDQHLRLGRARLVGLHHLDAGGTAASNHLDASHARRLSGRA